MKWADTILFDRPLRDVALLANSPAQEWQTFVRDREAAAFESGRRAGETALNEQLILQRNETVELQRGIFGSLQAALPHVIREAETTVIELAFETAKKLVAGLTVDAAMVEGTVREALRQCENTSEIVVQLHPDDLALMHAHQATVLNGLPETGALKFSGSAEITRGGCVIQTKFGLVDARRETKIEQLRQSLST